MAGDARVSIYPRLTMRDMAKLLELRRAWRTTTTSAALDRAINQLIAVTDQGRHGLLVPPLDGPLVDRHFRIGVDTRAAMEAMAYTDQVVVRAAIRRYDP